MKIDGFGNVNVTGIDAAALDRDEKDVLYHQARYCQAMTDPVIKVNGDSATITYTSVLNANAYGARGTFRMKCTHSFIRKDGKWIEE